MEKKSVIVEESFRFGVSIVRFTDELQLLRKFILAQQLLRSGTSIGANVREAQHAESMADFIHKMKIAAKEAEETCYWLELCSAVEGYPAASSLLLHVQSLQRILGKIISTAKQRLQQRKEYPNSTAVANIAEEVQELYHLTTN